MTTDVVMFLDDFDMLDCRLHELLMVVDRFIVIEGDHTFSGIPKPYHLTEAIAAGRYADYPITVVRAELSDVSMIRHQQMDWVTPETEDNWKREAKQREAARDLLAALPPDEIVLYGDLDEIPRAETVRTFSGPVSSLWMYYLVYSLRYRHPQPWCGTVIGCHADMGSSPLTQRGMRGAFPRIPNAGWHLGWFGDPETRMRKLAAHSHQELAAETGQKLAVDYPTKMLHVNNGVKLMDYDSTLGLPRWTEEGYAPEVWYKKWDPA